MEKVSQADLSVIYDARENRYRGVQRWRRKWRVVYRSNGRIVTSRLFDTEGEASREMVRVYRRRYGDGWAEVVRRGTRAATTLRKIGHIYCVDATVCGVTFRVTSRLVTDGTGAVGEGWATRADASRARKEYREIMRDSTASAQPLLVSI